MVQDGDRAPKFVVAPLERLDNDVLRRTSACPNAWRGSVRHRTRAWILCKGSLRRIGGSANTNRCPIRRMPVTVLVQGARARDRPAGGRRLKNASPLSRIGRIGCYTGGLGRTEKSTFAPSP